MNSDTQHHELQTAHPRAQQSVKLSENPAIVALIANAPAALITALCQVRIEELQAERHRVQAAGEAQMLMIQSATQVADKALDKIAETLDSCQHKWDSLMKLAEDAQKVANSPEVSLETRQFAFEMTKYFTERAVSVSESDRPESPLDVLKEFFSGATSSKSIVIDV
jgi:hypothetical protein